jgi:hypothetical protein
MKLVHLAACATALLVPACAFAAEVVPLGHFDSVGLEGGGHVNVKYGPQQRVTLLKGSTQYTRLRVENGHSLNIEACNESCPHQYDLEVEIVTPVLEAAAISGGGEIVAHGNFPNVESFSAAVNGGGDIDVHAVSAKTVHAAVSGGGGIHVTATAMLNAAVSGGGSIVYSGNPQVNEAVNGGGSVERAR